MSYGDTLSRCDTTAFVTALALVADAMRRDNGRRPKGRDLNADSGLGAKPARVVTDAHRAGGNRPNSPYFSTPQSHERG